MTESIDSESITNSKLQLCCWVKNLMIDVPNFAQCASFLSLLKLSRTSKEMRERLLPILKAKRLQELKFLQTWFSIYHRHMSLEELINLKNIYLSGAGITKIPPEIGQLIKLENLWLNENKITEIPPEIGLLINLRGLYLSRNQITIIPPEIGQLTQQHGSFPAGAKPAEQRCNLIELYLAYNQITVIPPEIGQLTNLKVLWLRDNQITVIPPEIGQLTNLKVLWLRDNQITSIPSNLKRSGLTISI